MPRLLIVGAGGHGREVEWLAREVGTHELLGFIDGQLPVGTTVGSLQVLGGNSAIPQFSDAELVMAIGDLRRRQQAVDEILSIVPNVRFARLIHPSAICGDSSTVGDGTVICAGALVTVNARIGKHVIVNHRAAVGHESVIGNFCTLGPGSIVCGNSELSDGVEIAAGAVIRQGLHFGHGSMAAMGAVVMKNVPAGAMVLGNPARPIQELPAFPFFPDPEAKS